MRALRSNRLFVVLGLALLLIVGSPDSAEPASVDSLSTRFLIGTGPGIPSSPFGAQLLTSATDPKFIPVLAQAKALGVRWVRVDLAWNIIQPVAPATPGCGNCDWSYPDLLFSTLAAQGFTPIVTLWGSPSWVTPYPNGPIGSDHLGDLGNFVSALAQRYPNVQYWEFYNEPDNWGPVSGWGGAGQQYAAMLTTAYNAIHPNGAQGTGGIPQYVVFGGIAYEPEFACPDRPKGQCFDNNFVADVLDDTDGSSPFDIMAFHFYAGFAGNYTPANIIGKATKLKQTYPLLRAKPFLVTELGKGYASTDDPTYSHEITARLVVQMFATLMAGVDKRYGVNMVAGTWFTLEHNETLAGKQIRKWGLLDEQGNPWPLEGAAYRTVAKELSNTSYLGPVDGTGVEGYEFAAPDGSIHSVLWATGDAAHFSYPGYMLRRFDERGAATTLVDSGGEDADPRRGWIGMEITPDPVFVETNVRISLPLIFHTNPFARGVQLRVMAVLCQTFGLPCDLN